MPPQRRPQLLRRTLAIAAAVLPIANAAPAPALTPTARAHYIHPRADGRLDGQRNSLYFVVIGIILLFLATWIYSRRRQHAPAKPAAAAPIALETPERPATPTRRRPPVTRAETNLPAYGDHSGLPPSYQEAVLPAGAVQGDGAQRGTPGELVDGGRPNYEQSQAADRARPLYGREAIPASEPASQGAAGHNDGAHGPGDHAQDAGVRSGGAPMDRQ